MKKLIKSTLNKIEKKFNYRGRYITSEDNKTFCPQVNGLANICLKELGFTKKAKKNCESFTGSSARDKSTGLFWREVDTNEKVIVPQINACKNSIMSLSLAMSDFPSAANNVMDLLEISPLFDQESGLFMREYNPVNKKVNTMILTQTNLWAALAYISLNKYKEAKKIISSLEKTKFDNEYNLFTSQDCRYYNSKQLYFADDQALAILVYIELGEREKALSLAKAILESPLYDSTQGLFNSKYSKSHIDRTKSTYKNSLMAIAFSKLNFKKTLSTIQRGLVTCLYDPKDKLFHQTTNDKTKVPDNSALALVALSYNC